jgi:hypothetical protein
VNRQIRSPLKLLLATTLGLVALSALADPSDLRKTAHDYYRWRDDAYPVETSGLGDHRLDSKLTDFRMTAVLARRQHVSDLLQQINALDAAGWPEDDRIDRVLFQ